MSWELYGRIRVSDRLVASSPGRVMNCRHVGFAFACVNARKYDVGLATRNIVLVDAISL